ncbi:MAG TPA: ribonuclease HI family protein [Microlunatus sp.]|nr:ribonuclease HI family protein [Microlunatus sp.]
MTLIAAADGSALGNPGPAGWGWYIDEDHWASGGWPHGTNNMGELTAVLDLLRQTATSGDDLLIYCDSMYVINSITKWMPGWKRKNWRKGDGKPVQNVDIMKALDAALQGRRVRFEWVKGHAGHDLNEQADRLANAAAVAYSQQREPDHGPGFCAGSGAVAEAGAEQHGETTAATEVEPGEPEDLFSAYEVAVPTPPVLSDEEQVVALERSLLSADVRADRGEVAALLHPQWCEIGRSGRLWTREELLEEIEPLAEPVSLDVVALEWVDRDALLLIWRALGDRGSTLRSSLWVRERGRWRQRFHQGTAET